MNDDDYDILGRFARTKSTLVKQNMIPIMQQNARFLI